DDRDSRNRPASLLDVKQSRRPRQIGVPDVVVNDLEVPQVLSGIRIGCDEARAEEIVAFTIAAVLIHRRRAKWHVDDAALDVDGDEAPDVHPRPLLPALALPGVVVLLAPARY